MSDNKTEQKPVIRIENLHKYFGDNQVLRGIDLEVMPGEKVVVLGPSGSGKSTMLRCINALEETTSGKIYVNDVDITSPKTDINKVREHLGMVFQRFNLWPHKTVLENVALAPKLVSGVNKAEAEKKAMEMLKRVGLAEKANAYPASLSGGQQQRVAIARGLAMGPKALLFDEPTSALGPGTRGRSAEGDDRSGEIRYDDGCGYARNGLCREVADRVIFMDGGVIVEQGKPEDVLLHPKEERTRTFLKRVLPASEEQK